MIVTMSTHVFLTLLFVSLCFIVSFSHAITGFSVDLIHRDSPKSPVYQATENKYQRVVNAARRSINFANHFNKKSPTYTPRSTVIPDKGEYLMTYSVGTPPFKLYGIVDTGSELVWFQCQPCKKCYNQTMPIFNPSKSSSYKNIRCSTKVCRCNDQNNCQYSITYEDGSHSQGDISMETLTLESTTGVPISFPKTVIGCGTNNTMSFQGASSGIVGLGGPESLIAQLGSSIDGKFSYCLIPSFLESNMTSKLIFGDVAVVSGDGVVSTPIVKKNPPMFYVLTLEALSVGNKRVKFRGSSSSDEGDIFIDSGSTYTILPSDVYANLESTMLELVKLERTDDPTRTLNLCYNVTSDAYDFPLITAHFKGADVKLYPISTFVPIADDIVCFAFISSDRIVPIFGNLAQQNLLIGYDLKKMTVSFKPMDCTKM